MPVHNADVARQLNKMADLLEIDGANPFRVRAYRNAARSVGDLSKEVAELVNAGEDLSELPGIGEDLAGKIGKIVEIGTFEELTEIEGQGEEGLETLLRVRGVGPTRVQALHRELKISSLEELKKAAEEGKIRGLSGFGEKTEQTILQEIEKVAVRAERFRIDQTEQVAQALVTYLEESDGCRPPGTGTRHGRGDPQTHRLP